MRYLHRGWYPSVNVQALFDLAALASGQTVLVNGAGGAVGGYVVQLAKQPGAVVTATPARAAPTPVGCAARRLSFAPDRSAAAEVKILAVQRICDCCSYNSS